MILNALLDKYEASKSLVEKCNRRILLKVEAMEEYDIEDFEAKTLFHDVIFDLEKEGLVLYAWKKHEERKFVTRNLAQ